MILKCEPASEQLHISVKWLETSPDAACGCRLPVANKERKREVFTPTTAEWDEAFSAL